MNPSSISRRSVIKLALGATASGQYLGQPLAQTGAVRRVVVPVPAGGGMDNMARIFAESTREAIGPSIVDNRPGGALRIAIDFVRQANPDGMTLLFAPASPFTIYPHIYKKLSYDYQKDFTAVGGFCSFDFALGVPGNSPINTLAEYITAVKNEPNKFGQFAVPAAGASPHFVGSHFGKVAGIQLQHIPYRGSAPAMQDLMAGAVPSAFNLTGEFVQMAQGGRVKVLATTGNRRSQFMPNIPTFQELGYKDMVFSEWFGVFAPAKTPAKMLDTLSSALESALRNPEVIAKIQAANYSPFNIRPSELNQRIQQENTMWGPLVKATGFTLDE